VGTYCGLSTDVVKNLSNWIMQNQLACEGIVAKNKGRVETQPRFKIQYPMKNHSKDAVSMANRCINYKINFKRSFT
jgi:hypothetical protein